MESHHPTELGVVKRVRMEGVRVTFFVLTVAIEAISTMEILVSKIVMGTMMVTIGGNTVTALTSVSVITPPGIFMVLMASMVAVKRKNVTLTLPPSFLPSLPPPALLDGDFPSSILLAALRHM